MNDPNFVSLEKLDRKVVKKNSRIVQDTPLQVAIGVYSYAKLKLLEFWLFLDENFDKSLWCLTQIRCFLLWVVIHWMNLSDLKNGTVGIDLETKYYASRVTV